MSKQKPVYTDEERIDRLWSQEQIKDLMGRRQMYLANDWRARELDELWVSLPENKATASYGRNWGYYTGLDNIRAWYVDELDKDVKNDNLGVLVMHPVTTPLVVLADDGQTAQGTWWSLGFEGKPDETGEAKVFWYGIKLAADFILENGAWKLWHLFESNDYEYECGTSMGGCKTFPEPGTLKPELEFKTPTIPMTAHKRCFGWVDGYPHLPDRYDTFSEDIGFGPEGNPRYNGQLKGVV